MPRRCRANTLAFVLLLASLAPASGPAWLTDFEAASQRADDEEKDLLIEFTGSDWCSPCIGLKTQASHSLSEF